MFILGDSTAAAKEESCRPETGWGEVFGKYLRQGWRLINMAVNGMSTKTVLSSGVFGRALSLASSGDVALIQFGHNDEKLDDSERGADAWHAYIVNLIYMVEKFREKGVRSVLITSIARRRFIDGILVDTHGDWPAAMKAAAEKAGVECIDLTIPTMVGIAMKGDDGSKEYFMNFAPGLYDNYPDGKEDDTHLRPAGAEWVAGLLHDRLLDTAAGQDALL